MTLGPNDAFTQRALQIYEDAKNQIASSGDTILISRSLRKLWPNKYGVPGTRGLTPPFLLKLFKEADKSLVY